MKTITIATLALGTLALMACTKEETGSLYFQAAYVFGEVQTQHPVKGVYLMEKDGKQFTIEEGVTEVPGGVESIKDTPLEDGTYTVLSVKLYNAAGEETHSILPQGHPSKWLVISVPFRVFVKGRTMLPGEIFITK